MIHMDGCYMPCILLYFMLYMHFYHVLCQKWQNKAVKSTSNIRHRRTVVCLMNTLGNVFGSFQSNYKNWIKTWEMCRLFGITDVFITKFKLLLVEKSDDLIVFLLLNLSSLPPKWVRHDMNSLSTLSALVRGINRWWIDSITKISKWLIFLWW